jgi:HEAT repeat protein/uncharacterized membrane protein
MNRPSANLVRFYSLNLFLSAGLFLADTLSETLFLSTFGVVWLPAGLIGTAVLSVIFTYLTTRYLHGRDAYQLLLPLTIGSAIMAALIWLGLQAEITAVVAIFFLAFRPLRDQLVAQMWNFYAEQYDAQQAKRYFPILGSAGRIGAIIGYAVLLLLVNTFGTAASMFAWIFSLFLGGVLLWQYQQQQKSRAVNDGTANRPHRAHDQPTTASKPLDRTVLRQYRLIPYILGYSVLTIIVVMLLTYQVGATLVVAYPEADQLSSIYATIGIVSNLLLWVFQAAFLPRIIRRFGLPNTNLVFPAVALTIGAWISAAASVPAAVLGQVTRTTLRQALHIPVEDLLFNALPPQYKVSTRTLLRGAVIPMGAVVAGLMLMLLQGFSWGATAIAGLTMLVGGANLWLAFLTNRYYRRATLALVQEQNFVTQRLALTGFGTATPEARQILAERLAQTNDLEEALFLAEVLVEVASVDAEAPIVRKLPTATPDIQVALLEVLQHHGVAGANLAKLAPTLLQGSDTAVRLSTLNALTHSKTHLAVAPFAPYLADADTAVRLAAIALWAHKGQTDQQNQARLALSQLLDEAQDVPTLTTAVALLPQLDPSRLATYLYAPQPQLREAAVAATANMPQLPRFHELVEGLRRATQDSTEAVRQAALRAIAQIGMDALPTLQNALGDRSPAVRQVAVDGISALGSRTIEPLRQQLATTSDDTVREAVLTALLTQLPKHRLPELATFEQETLLKAYETALLQNALQPVYGPAGELLLADLGDAFHAYTERLYRLIAATSNPTAASAMQAGLAHPDKHRQAQALEALEVARSPEYAVLLGALAHPDDVKSLRELGHKQLSITPPTNTEAWIQVGQERTEWRMALLSAAQAEQNSRGPIARRYPIPARTNPDVPTIGERSNVLSVIEKAIFLKAVPSFTSMTTEQLRILATAAEEYTYLSGEIIFEDGDPGDSMMIIVSGRVGIESKRGRAFVRIETFKAKDSFGEFTVFDAQPRTARAIAVEDCLILIIRRDVLLDLMRRYPDMSFEIIKLLSRRLRETTAKMASKTRAHTREVIDLFDKFDE